MTTTSERNGAAIVVAAPPKPTSASPERRVKAMSKAHPRYRLADGTIVPGVTTVLGKLAKPALISWANRMGLDGIDTSKYVDTMAEVGTYCHYMILCDLAGEDAETDKVSAEVRDLAENSFLSYLEWKRGKRLVPDLVEAQLVSESHRYGGTPDFFGTVDGVPTVIDFKTSSAIFPEHIYQLAAYWHLLAENNRTVELARVLQIGRSNNESYSEQVFNDPADRLSLFLHLRQVYEIERKLGGSNRWKPRRKKPSTGRSKR